MISLLATAALAFATLFEPISREEAAKGEAVAVTGVVTCVAYWQTNSFVMAAVDDPNGPALYVTGEHPKARSTPISGGSIFVGDRVAVKGVRTPMFFAPGVSATRIERLASDTLPEPPPRRLADFAWGRLDNRRVTLKGVVHEVVSKAPHQSSLRLFTEDGFVDVRIPVPAADVTDLMDAEVSCSGVGMSRFNPRAEFLGVRLEVPSRADIMVLKKPESDPFERELTEITDLLAWTPAGNDGHLRKIVGEVTARSGVGEVYVQQGETGVKVSLAQDELPALGAAVEIVGFPEMIDGMGEIRAARWRLSALPVPTCCPREVMAENLRKIPLQADNTYQNLDCQLVRLCGRLSWVGERDLELEVEGALVRVRMAFDIPSWIVDETACRPRVSVTGVLRLNLESRGAEGRRMEIAHAELIARGPEDLVLVPDAVWRRAHLALWWQRALNASFLVVFVLVAVIGVLLFKSRQRRHEAALLAADRKRMAGDLHDTIEQHLAGAKILLTTALGVPDGMKPAAESAVTVAAEVLLEAKRQIRDVILNLRNEELMQKPLDALIRSVADAVNRQGTARVRVMLRGAPPDLHAGAKTDLVAIVQQAITNAITHGKAKNVVIVSDPGSSLRIANDGIPFDPGTALGPDAGHFGLSSMRERAKRSGFSFTIGTDGKWTVVRLERS